MMEAMYLESLYEGDPMHETMGLSGTDCLWILGKPYSLGGGGGGGGGLGPSRPLSSYRLYANRMQDPIYAMKFENRRRSK